MLKTTTEIHAGDERAVAKQFASPYDQALAIMQPYRAWDSPSGSCPPRFQEEYERPHVIEMSLSDWGKVSRELHLDEESDEKYDLFSCSLFLVSPLDHPSPFAN